jgi:enterochelin esterase family protein
MKFITAACIAVLLILPAKTQEQLTPKSAQAVLAANPDGEAATQLANRLRAWFGADNLKKGPNPKTNQLDVAWAIETPGAKSIHVVSDDGDWRLPLKKLGATDVWAVSALLPEGTGLKWHYDVDGKAIGGNFIEVYSTPIEAMEQGAPKGKVTEMPVWKSNIFPGTERKWWVYVPAQYKDDKPACVMVFQDGNSYRNWVPTVFDNLIAKGEMPVTVGVFIDPGVGPNEKRNRSFEYDTLSDQYARFLLEEILPEVEKTTKLKKDAASRAICGASSGGICAFTVAWQKPDQFHKVVSWIGSFTNIAHGATMREGGHNYEALIRKTPPKPIRVFLQDGANDLDNNNGNWPLANQQMAKSLAFAKYDYKFVYGQGAHNHNHGRAIFPETLRWLWRDYPKE